MTNRMKSKNDCSVGGTSKIFIASYSCNCFSIDYLEFEKTFSASLKPGSSILSSKCRGATAKIIKMVLLFLLRVRILMKVYETHDE